MPEDIITSNSPKGCVITMNVWVRADAESEMISVMAPVLTKLREDPNCLWLDACRNPRDPTHYRYVHGWKTDSKYFFEKYQRQEWFQKYLEELGKLRLDKDRVIEHFDRVDLE